MFLSPDFFLKTHSEAHESTSWRSPAEKQGIWYFVILISWASRLADFQSLGWMFFNLPCGILFFWADVCVCVFLKFAPFHPPLWSRPHQTVSSAGSRLFLRLEVWLNPVRAAWRKEPPHLTPPPYLSNSRIISYSSPFMLRACFSSLLRSGFFFGRNKREKENKQTSGNAQMCRCTNRLDSSSVVVLGYLRGKGKQNKKGHQLRAMGHLCTGGTILELNVFQSSSVVFGIFWLNLYAKTFSTSCYKEAIILTFQADWRQKVWRFLGVGWGGQANRTRGAFHIWGRAPCSSCISTRCMIDLSEGGAESPTVLSCGPFPWRILLSVHFEMCV